MIIGIARYFAIPPSFPTAPFTFPRESCGANAMRFSFPKWRTKVYATALMQSSIPRECQVTGFSTKKPLAPKLLIDFFRK